MSDHLPTLRRSASIARAACLTLAAWVPTTSSAQSLAKPPAEPAASAKADPVVDQLVEGHNKERAKEKLPPLKLDPLLVEAARVHAKDMADHDKMGHEGSDESTPEQRVVNAGYRYLRTGENVAVGYRDVTEVVQGWMDSPGHRKNIMGDFTEIGVALVLGKNGKPFWCAEFGTPLRKFEPAVASKDLVKRINDERVAAKVPALEVDEKLAKAAQDQAANMAKTKSPGGGTPTMDGLDQRLFPDLAVSTASGHPDAQTIVKLFFEKPDLKAQVLGKFSKIGTGYAMAENGVPYWCLILGNPARSVNTRSRR